MRLTMKNNHWSFLMEFNPLHVLCGAIAWLVGAKEVDYLFAWYDLWIGAYWDREKKWLYILPLPCVGIILKYSTPEQ